MEPTPSADPAATPQPGQPWPTHGVPVPAQRHTGQEPGDPVQIAHPGSGQPAGPSPWDPAAITGSGAADGPGIAQNSPSEGDQQIHWRDSLRAPRQYISGWAGPADDGDAAAEPGRPGWAVGTGQPAGTADAAAGGTGARVVDLGSRRTAAAAADAPQATTDVPDSPDGDQPPADAAQRQAAGRRGALSAFPRYGTAAPAGEPVRSAGDGRWGRPPVGEPGDSPRYADGAPHDDQGYPVDPDPQPQPGAPRPGPDPRAGALDAPPTGHGGAGARGWAAAPTGDPADVGRYLHGEAAAPTPDAEVAIDPHAAAATTGPDAQTAQSYDQLRARWAVRERGDQPGRPTDQPDESGDRLNDLGDQPGVPGGRPGGLGDQRGELGDQPGEPGRQPGGLSGQPGGLGDQPGELGGQPGGPDDQPGELGDLPGGPGAFPGHPGEQPGRTGGGYRSTGAPVDPAGESHPGRDRTAGGSAGTAGGWSADPLAPTPPRPYDPGLAPGRPVGAERAPVDPGLNGRAPVASAETDVAAPTAADAGPAEQPGERGGTPTDGPSEPTAHDDEPQPADTTPAVPLRPGDVTQTTLAVWDDAGTQRYKDDWHEVKALFVDEPEEALSKAGALVTAAVNEVTAALLAEQRRLDPLRQSSAPDTETMRVAMRRYREFLDRILAL